jgi:branched-chain amino acid transport system permease protein
VSDTEAIAAEPRSPGHEPSAESTDERIDHAAGPAVYRRHQLRTVGAFAVFAVVLGVTVSGRVQLGLLGDWVTLSIIGVGFYAVFGLGGQFAFSQAAFYGLGAYTSAWATGGHIEGSELVGGRNFLVGSTTAVVVAVAVAVVFSLVVRRTDQFYFAITTLALSQIAAVVFANWEGFSDGGEVSRVQPAALGGFEFDTGARRYWLLLAGLLLVLVLTALVERSPLRRDAIAVRDNPLTAATAGTPLLATRITMMAFGSAVAAFAGSLYAHTHGALTLDSFGIELGIDVFLIVLLGGLYSMWGAVIGAAFVVWVPHELQFVGEHEGLVYGALLVIVMVAVPRGLLGVAESAIGVLAKRLRKAPR